MHKAGPMEISQNAMTLIANSNTRYVIRVDLNDDQGEWKFPLWPINCQLKSMFLITNRCHFGNFTNVPTTGCIKLKMKVTYVY